MDTIDGMKAVVAVVETGSFTAAGDRIGISKALVSKYIGQVESSLDVRLFNRTTRRISLTVAGRTYYDRVLPLLDEYSEMVDVVAGEQTLPQGLLRVSVPMAFGESNLSPLLPKFMERYPNLKIDLNVSDRMIDMLQEGIDVVVRLGAIDDSRFIARYINDFPLAFCASPDYLKEYGAPVKPEDLHDHNCIIDSNLRMGNNWPLKSADGSTKTIQVSSAISVNSPRAVKEIAIAGGGVALAPKFIIQDAFDKGDLKPLLEEFETYSFGMYAIYPHRRYVSKKIRCFIDFLKEEFSHI